MIAKEDTYKAYEIRGKDMHFPSFWKAKNTEQTWLHFAPSSNATTYLTRLYKKIKCFVHDMPFKSSKIPLVCYF